MNVRFALPTLATAMVVLSGCATTALETHRRALADTAISLGVPAPTPKVPTAQMAINDALKTPLTQDAAVTIALANSAEFHAMLAGLEAQTIAIARSAQPANPVLTFERLVKKRDGEVDLDIGRMLGISIVDWLTLPWRSNIADAQLIVQKHAAATTLVQKVATVRQAWVSAVAAQEKANYIAQVRTAAEASAELARRMRAVGNLSKLQHAREQAFYADATAQHTRALTAAASAREALVRALGLSEEQAQALQLPARLPDVPKELPEKPAAFEQRIDIQMANAQLKALSIRNGLETPLSILGGVHAEAIRASETGEPTQKGFGLTWSIPVFDLGLGARLESDARLREAMMRAQAIAVDAASSLREARTKLVATHALAKHYRDEIVPLRKAISEEMLLKYNGMLVGVFELLADAREQIGSVIAAVDATRDFWLAEATWQAAQLGVPITGVLLEAGGVATVTEKGH